MSKKTFYPNILRETSSGIYQIHIEDALLEKRDVYLTEAVNSETATALIQQFMYLEKENPGAPINFYINSPGGSVKDGLAVYDVIRLMKSPVTTICIGMAASMGSILFLAADKRLMLPHSEIMIHDASFGQAEFSGLKPDEIQQKTDDLLETCKTLRGIIEERTGLSAKVVRDKMKKDSYFKADEAMKLGIATDILSSI